MSAKWNYIFGATTIALIVGGTVYVIIKSKQAENAEEDSITLAEAKDIVARAKSNDEVRFESDIEEVVVTKPILVKPSGSKIQGIKPSMIVIDEYNDPEEEDVNEEDMEAEIERVTNLDRDDILHDKYEQLNEMTPSPSIEPLKDFMYFEEGIDPKEDKDLRHDKDSVEAKHQFIRMELAEWEVDDNAYRIMLQLFEFPFIPTTDGDEVLRTQIIHYKVQFFGLGSKWNREVSFADVMLHYARAAEFNCGESVSYWVEYFLNFSSFEWDITSQEIDTLLLRINSHSYFNDERQTFGLFGLTRESMDQAIRIANRNIDRSVTHEIEFQEFLKSHV